MPVMSGRLMPNNVPVDVLRDTGCDTCVVRHDLVQPHQFTGKHQSVVMIDRTVRTFPVAKVEVDSPYFTGEIEALCVPNSVVEVVIGNVEGAREPSDPNLEWEPQGKVSLNTERDTDMRVGIKPKDDVPQMHSEVGLEHETIESLSLIHI